MAFGWSARFAVLVFFLLSGRLITASIASNIRKGKYFDSADYFLNRVCRIYPPLLFAIFLVMAVVAVVHLFALPGANGSQLGTLRASGLWFTPTELVQSILIYDGLTIVDGPLWSLYVEVKLYIVAGGIAFATPDDAGSPVKDEALFLLHEKPQPEWLDWLPKIPIAPAG